MMEARRAFLALGIVLGLSVLWFAVLRIVRPSDEATWIESIYKIKESAARQPGPKVLLIGGSATHFSFSAELVSKATGLRVVNFGTHAGLGAGYLLDRARRNLQAGDTAVISLEYPLLRSGGPSQVLVDYVAFFDPAYVLRAKAADWLPLAFGFGPVELLKTQINDLLPHGNSFYGSGYVSEFGDERGAREDMVDAQTRERVRAAPPIVTWSVLREGAPVALREFAEWSRANHVALLYVWPPTVYRDVYTLPQFVGFLRQIQDLYESVGVKTLGRPSEYFLPLQDMLDTPYHANVKGQAVASGRLSVDLCVFLDCSTAGSDP